MSKINESQVRQEILILEDQLKSLGSLSPENQHLLQQLRSAVESPEKPKERQLSNQNMIDLSNRAIRAERQRDELLQALKNIVKHQNIVCPTAPSATKLMAVNAITEFELQEKGGASDL